MKDDILELMESKDGKDPWLGFKRTVRRPLGWNRRLRHFMELAENRKGFSSRKWSALMEEAHGLDDFPTLFGDTLDRQMLAAYRAIPKQMRRILRQKTVKDFRQVRRSHGEGLTGRLQEVKPGGEYLALEKKAVDHYTYTPLKYGKRVEIDWEAFLNDDLGFFDDIPQQLATAVAHTEEFLLTSLFWDSDGPVDSYFAAGTGKGTVQSDALSSANLGAAIRDMAGAIAGYRDDAGEPILNVPKWLVVPPALVHTAKEILRVAEMSKSSGVRPTAAVAVIGEEPIEVIVNPWIPVIDTTHGSESWALFSANIDVGEVGNLKGHTGPEIFVKTAGVERVGGGAVTPFDGDMEDLITYKVRYVQGQVTLDPRGGYASDGS